MLDAGRGSMRAPDRNPRVVTGRAVTIAEHPAVAAMALIFILGPPRRSQATLNAWPGWFNRPFVTRTKR
jgi:hypothetical protein